ncbi:hypothetical protein BDV96DRAFT_611946 [Lophiotrema nucula]|uniref:Uncharacterized protein n=1 Tax=Lophiotrema nucula TaxID=690887 RepID=A0A6A5ZBZ7_9PLEO|nr:hypothetical protein BDV96DRAFT_611946 [Lophiotrema nucula]
MPLRKRVKEKELEASRDGENGESEGTVKKSKRERLRAFFRSRKQRTDDVVKIPVAVDKNNTRKPARDSKIAESPAPKPTKSSSDVDVTKADGGKEQGTQLPTPPAEPKVEEKVEEKAEPLSEDQVHALFSGAPHFGLTKTDKRNIPGATYPWDEDLKTRDVSDSVQLAQPAFSGATLRRHLPVLQTASDQEKPYQGFDVGIVEVPSMLSAQGIEPGTIGLTHFLELPVSDNLVTDLQQSQSSNGFLESVRNKEQMQSNPEKLGIRAVDMTMVYDRLIEFGDLIEAFQESPERMTILNNQSSGDLYATLFGKYLMPPKYDGTTNDPTGIKVQIDTLLKILRLKGVWYDFSLVEWRIRLGQVLWSDPEILDEQEPQSSTTLWSKRDILLFQVMLSCELLLRLDAVSSMEADDVISQMHVTKQEYEGFLNLKTKKTEWDMVLARRFLENILVVKESESMVLHTPKTKGLLSLLSSNKDEGPTDNADIILLPRHQTRQLTGLLHFAETIQWPGLDLVLKELALKLGVTDAAATPEPQISPYGKFLDPSTPSSISIYGTPLASPRSLNGISDSYFGNVTKPSISRSNSTSRSLKVPLSSILLAHAADSTMNARNIGGWLSRSFLTGLILPGEAISHFLISTLLENDKLAIAALGDSANLYGGFVYSERSWWSKSSVVARVLAGIEGSIECMGWISISKLPEGLTDGWYNITSQQIPHEQPPRISIDDDVVDRDSDIIPGQKYSNVKPEDLVLPKDSSTPPVPSIEFTGWKLTLLTTENSDPDESPGMSEAETYTASLTFNSVARHIAHAFNLTHDTQFVTSFPCTPPRSSSTPSFPTVLKRTISRSSSKSTRSGSQRPSRHPSRRNSHGFEPLLSHPPDSPAVGPTRIHSPIPDEDGTKDILAPSGTTPMTTHPLHISYKYKIVLVTEILDAEFALPFRMPSLASPASSPPNSPGEQKDEPNAEENNIILILDARSSTELELLARAWCAERGLHAIIGRASRTCLACCVREARGLGIKVVIRI